MECSVFAVEAIYKTRQIKETVCSRGMADLDAVSRIPDRGQLDSSIVVKSGTALSFSFSPHHSWRCTNGKRKTFITLEASLLDTSESSEQPDSPGNKISGGLGRNGFKWKIPFAPGVEAASQGAYFPDAPPPQH